MTDQDHATSGSFAHAFLPGLILGLVIGAVAGAFLPDLLGGNRIPAPATDATPAAAGDRDARDEMPSQEELQEMIDEAVEDAQEADPEVPAETPPATPPAGSP